MGPTAVGKTDLALRLAEEIDGEIISADSMQVYRGMDIGTAKPSTEERERVRHHLVDVVAPDEPFSVSSFIQMSQEAIQDCLRRQRQPIVAGGTGFYVDALVEGFLFRDTSKNPELRNELQNAWEKDPQSLWEDLRRVDPESADRLHPNDARRIIRALEVYRETGRPLSILQHEGRQQDANYSACWFGLTRERSDLYQRIGNRVDQMIHEGLLKEVKDLFDQYPERPTAMQALGYKEIGWFLDGYVTWAEAVYLLKRDTRRFAKRQLSWFRRRSEIRWSNLSTSDYEAVYKDILNLSCTFLENQCE